MTQLDLTLSDFEDKFKATQVLKPYISDMSLVEPYVTIERYVRTYMDVTAKH